MYRDKRLSQVCIRVALWAKVIRWSCFGACTGMALIDRCHSRLSSIPQPPSGAEGCDRNIRAPDGWPNRVYGV